MEILRKEPLKAINGVRSGGLVILSKNSDGKYLVEVQEYHPTDIFKGRRNIKRYKRLSRAEKVFEEILSIGSIEGGKK